jgi:hypothetical protein
MSAADAERVALSGAVDELRALYRRCRRDALGVRAARLRAVASRVRQAARWGLGAGGVLAVIAPVVSLTWSAAAAPATPEGVRILILGPVFYVSVSLFGKEPATQPKGGGTAFGCVSLLALLLVVPAVLLTHAALAWPLRVSGYLVLSALGIGAVAGLTFPDSRESAAIEPHPILAGPQLRVGTERLARRPGAGGRPAVPEAPALGGAAGALPDGVRDCHCWAWWPYGGLTVLVPAPVLVHAEWAGDRRRLHCSDGPAVRWRDGTEQHWWHGLRVPAELFGDDWSPRWIGGLGNTEMRRAAIEIVGWPEFLRRAGLHPLATAPDPGNTGRHLTLYDAPHGFGGAGQRLLVMTNGSPDRDGRPRHYAELVPNEFEDPVAAAAWQYGVPVETYRLLQRRT